VVRIIAVDIVIVPLSVTSPSQCQQSLTANDADAQWFAHWLSADGSGSIGPVKLMTFHFAKSR
jgi:hypothetical protein